MGDCRDTVTHRAISLSLSHTLSRGERWLTTESSRAECSYLESRALASPHTVTLTVAGHRSDSLSMVLHFRRTPARWIRGAAYATPYGHEKAVPLVVFVTVLCRRYSCMPASPHSLPKPLAFQPPKGVCARRQEEAKGNVWGQDSGQEVGRPVSRSVGRGLDARAHPCTCGQSGCEQLIQTVPASSAAATRSHRSSSADITACARP